MPPDNLPEYAPGQIWKDKFRNPECMFTVLEVYQADHGTLRVVGALCGSDGFFEKARELDARSMFAMFPHPVFLHREEKEEDK